MCVNHRYYYLLVFGILVNLLASVSVQLNLASIKTIRRNNPKAMAKKVSNEYTDFYDSYKN